MACHEHEGPHDRPRHVFDPRNAERLDAPARRAAFPVEAYLQALAPWPGLRLADLGCGTGYFTLPVLDALRGQGTFYAVDISTEMLDALDARLRVHPYSKRVVMVRSEPCSVPLPDGCADAVVMGALLHEVEDPQAFLREARRLLAELGRILVADWDRRPGQTGQSEIGPPYEHRIPREEAEAALRNAGFVSIRSHEGFQNAYLLSAMKERA